MKYLKIVVLSCHIIVAPLVGAWIEILRGGVYYLIPFVAPLVGAWIEITFELIRVLIKDPSLLSWERGLKLHYLSNFFKRLVVAPLVGAWIEIVVVICHI